MGECRSGFYGMGKVCALTQIKPDARRGHARTASCVQARVSRTTPYLPVDNRREAVLAGADATRVRAVT